MRAALLLFVVACGTKREAPPASTSSGSAVSAKRVACEKAIRVVVGFTAAVSVRVAEQLGGNSSKLVTCLQTGASPDTCFEMKREVDAAIDTCMQWPDDAVACMADPDRMPSAECMRALERWQGLASSEPAATGPAPRWQLALPFDPIHAVRTASHIVLGSDAGVVALAGGKVAWTAKAPAGTALVDADRCVLAVGDKDVACLAPGGGTVQWRATLPPRSNPDDDDILFTSGAARGASIVLATSSGAMYTPSPATCKRKPTACLTASGKTADGVDDIALLPDGARVLSSVSRVFITDPRGRTTTTFTAGLIAGAGVEPSGGVLVAADSKLLHVDLAACAASGSDPTPIDSAACTTTIATFDDNPEVPITADGAVFVVVGTQLHRVGAWKIELGRMSAPLAVSGTIYVLAQDGLDAPVELRAIDPATGKTRWSSRLADSTDLIRPHIISTDDDLVVIVGVRAYGFALTRSP